MEEMNLKSRYYGTLNLNMGRIVLKFKNLDTDLKVILLDY